MEIFQRIENKLFWYRENSNTATLHEVLTVRDRLACDSYDLAEFVGNMYIEYNGHYFIRQINTSKKINTLIKAGSKVTQAPYEAKEQLEDIYRKELEKEGELHLAEGLLKQVNKVLDAMSQRISFQKKIEEEDNK